MEKYLKTILTLNKYKLLLVGKTKGGDPSREGSAVSSGDCHAKLCIDTFDDVQNKC